MTENTCSWIRALWPPVVFIGGTVVILATMSADVADARDAIGDHEARLRVLEQCLVETNAHMTDMAEDVRWMRDHWIVPAPVSEAP